MSKANDPDYVLNPATGRYCKKSGKLGQQILAGNAPQASSKATAKKSTGSKRTASAYILWSKDNRARVKAENPGLSFGQVAKQLGAEWKALSEAEKAPYVAQAQALKSQQE